MNTNIDYAAAQSCAANLRNYASSMEEILNNMRNEFNKVNSEGVWTGNSAEATRETLDTLSAKFNELHQAITDCGNFVDRSAAAYQSAETTIQSGL